MSARWQCTVFVWQGIGHEHDVKCPNSRSSAGRSITHKNPQTSTIQYITRFTCCICAFQPNPEWRGGVLQTRSNQPGLGISSRYVLIRGPVSVSLLTAYPACQPSLFIESCRQPRRQSHAICIHICGNQPVFLAAWWGGLNWPRWPPQIMLQFTV